MSERGGVGLYEAARRQPTACCLLHLSLRTCEQCGRAFEVPTSSSAPGRFCSKPCKGEWYAEHGPNTYRTRVGQGDRICVQCSGAFDSPRSWQRFCSTGCADRWHRRHDASHRQHKRLNTPALRRRILERDGWICYLCLRAIDEAAVAPDPLSGTIDHVVPLSRGGAHIDANLRATHLACNVDKGDAPAPWWVAA
jgi:5-methylcytosine-specific restriction endonuclease McrA